MKRVLLALTLASVAITPAFARGQTVPQSEYRALVHQCKDFLGRREITETEAKRLAAQIRNISAVTLPNGTTQSVDTKGEADALDAVSGTTPDKQLRARFDALDEQINSENKVVSGTKTDPQRLATKILSQKEFASSHAPKKSEGWDFSFLPKWFQPIAKFFAPLGKWISDLFHKIGAWMSKSLNQTFRAIGKFFRWLFRNVPKGKWKNNGNPFASLGHNVMLVLVFLAIVAAVVGAYFLAGNLYMVATGRRRGGGALGGDLDLTEEGITDPLSTAQERATQGDYRAAIRLTYIAALWRLGESGAITLEKNRTNWEYQRALRRKSPHLYDELLPATRLFDRVWYGKQTGTQAEFDSVSAIYAKLPTEFIDPEAVDQTTVTANKPEGSTV